MRPAERTGNAGWSEDVSRRGGPATHRPRYALLTGSGQPRWPPLPRRDCQSEHRRRNRKSEFCRKRAHARGGASAGVANHMGVAFGKACIFRGVQAGIHAGEDRKSTRRWQRQVSFLAPKPDAYFLLAATTSSTILDMGPLSDRAPVSEVYARRFRV
jgi:hypothetical protein